MDTCINILYSLHAKREMNCVETLIGVGYYILRTEFPDLVYVENIRPDRQTAMFSATFPLHIEALARRILKRPLEITVGEKGQTAHRIEQYVEVWPGHKEKFLRLLQLLGEWNEHGSIIIFVARQTEADELFAQLLKVSMGIQMDDNSIREEERGF